MARVFLQDIIEDLRFEDLPANWNSFDLENFSKSKKLWDYQKDALKNAIKVLWKYYEDFVDYQKGERLEVNQERKENFFQWYKDNGLEENLDIKLDKRKRNIYNLLTQYYPHEDRKILYEHFINRMCFWIATGSGKSLVIIKLIQILARLIERKEIPSHDILILIHRVGRGVRIEPIKDKRKRLVQVLPFVIIGFFLSIPSLPDKGRNIQIVFFQRETAKHPSFLMFFLGFFLFFGLVIF